MDVCLPSIPFCCIASQPIEMRFKKINNIISFVVLLRIWLYGPVGFPEAIMGNVVVTDRDLALLAGGKCLNDIVST